MLANHYPEDEYSKEHTDRLNRTVRRFQQL